MYTYFIKNNINSYTKIGKSQDVLNRMNQIPGSCSFIKLSLFHYIEGDYEKWFHIHYSKYRVEGEWFDIPDLTKEYIDQLMADGIPKLSIDIDKSYTKVYNTFYQLAFNLKGAIVFHMLFTILDIIETNDFKAGRDLYNKINVYFTKSGKEPISTSYFYRSIKNMVDTGLITKKKGSNYQLNPQIMWKGGSNKRLEVILDNQGTPLVARFNPEDGIIINPNLKDNEIATVFK